MDEGLTLGWVTSEFGKSGSRIRHVLDRDDDLEIELLGGAGSTTLHSRFGPTRNRAIRSSGRWVAERPIRWTGDSGLRFDGLDS